MKKNSKTPWGGGIKGLKPQKFGFTLAEVLITLAIIGIVAALTIPTLVSKNQNKQLYTQFMKTYNTLSNALNLAVAENGDPDGWFSFSGEDDEEEFVGSVFLTKYIAPYLKIAKVCGPSNYSECMPLDLYKSLSINSAQSLQMEEMSEELSDDFIAVLADGSTFALFSYITKEDFGATFFVDVNGKKGPNILGRDVFAFIYAKEEDNEPYRLTGTEDWDSSNANGCNPQRDNEEEGWACASRLLQEGAMNY